MSGVLVSLVIMVAEKACCIAFEVFPVRGIFVLWRSRELCELLRGRIMSSDKDLIVRWKQKERNLFQLLNRVAL